MYPSHVKSLTCKKDVGMACQKVCKQGRDDEGKFTNVNVQRTKANGNDKVRDFLASDFVFREDCKCNCSTPTDYTQLT